MALLLKKGYKSGVILRIVKLLIFLLGFYLFKRYFINRFIPISRLLTDIDNQKYKKLLLGHYFVLAFYKQKLTGRSSYAISSMRTLRPKNIIQAAQNARVENISETFISELGILNIFVLS